MLFNIIWGRHVINVGNINVTCIKSFSIIILNFWKTCLNIYQLMEIGRLYLLINKILISHLILGRHSYN